MITFTNPRHLAEFDDWPSGRDRVKCKFYIEHDAKRGWRVCRQTTDKHGKWCKPKTKTFSGMACIVDGSNGKTYILQLAQAYGFVTVSRHDFMDADPKELDRDQGRIGSNTASFHKEDPEHAALVALIISGQDAATMLYPNR